MKNIPVSGHLMVGPYKGYNGRAEFDSETGSFHGEVTDTRDVITFVGDDPKNVLTAFRDSIDDYLEFCEERGKAPDKPFSGRFLVRTSPQLHHELAVAAARSNKSLNQYIVDALTDALRKSFAAVTGMYTIEVASELELAHFDPVLQFPTRFEIPAVPTGERSSRATTVKWESQSRIEK